ncbi:hypothetical protein BASA60_005665 [Batrachochytrium salamandrivorans]|nr:hypothetical protein BASA60_005665 [Batrachochytrium salamandrivorans]
MPRMPANRSASRTHAPLPIRPVPPVALPFERWGIDFYGPMVETKMASFLAEGISEFERENSIRHLATTPYHPQTNGMVERMHAMLGHGLTTLVADKRDRWDEYLPQVLLAIRTRTHAVTGILAILPTLWNTPSTPNDETPPRSSLMPLDEIERMEEKLGIYCQELRGSWPGTISSKCQDQGSS